MRPALLAFTLIFGSEPGAPDAGALSPPPEEIPLADKAPYQPFTAEETPARIFRSRCAMCHGAEGKGNGRMLNSGLGARNVTSAEWQNSRSDDQIRASIMDGLPGTRMRAYADNGTEAQFNGLVALIRGMRGADAGVAAER